MPEMFPEVEEVLRMIMSLPKSLDVVSTKTADQRALDHLRRTTDMDWAPRAGCQPKTLAMACERCVYGSGEHRMDCTVVKFKIRFYDTNTGELRIATIPPGYVPAGGAEVLEEYAIETR